MELLSPAGNVEKLATAYRYGADAAYIGVQGFSLRAYADTISTDEVSPTTGASGDLSDRLRQLKGESKRLYAALNLFAHRDDLTRLPTTLERLALLPIDAVIIADIGLVESVREHLPDAELHLSTQANCTNAQAARVYHRMGFSRIIPARELTLDEVKAIKDAVPELAIEVFVHGAMCMAYSGRCLLSNALAGRDANRGDCAQSCRWRYRIEEEKRPGEYIEVETDGRYSTFLSARDLNLFDHIPALVEAGVDAVKIEGRMKSSYYVAAVTRSYRAAIDAAVANAASNDAMSAGRRSIHATSGDRTSVGVQAIHATSADTTPDAPALPAAHREELFRISHREYTTGFLMGDRSVHLPSRGDTPNAYRLMGIIETSPSADAGTSPRGSVPAGFLPAGFLPVTVKNTIRRDMSIEYLPPDPAQPPAIADDAFELRDTRGVPVDRITNAYHGFIRPSVPVKPGTIIRARRDQPRGGIQS